MVALGEPSLLVTCWADAIAQPRTRMLATEMMRCFFIVKLRCAFLVTRWIGIVAASFIDEDRDYEYDSGEAILASRKFSDYKSGVAFDLTKGKGDGLTFKKNGKGCPSISFNSRGLAVSPGGASGMGMGSVYLKNNNNTQRCVTVHKAGRIKIQGRKCLKCQVPKVEKKVR